MKNADVRFGPFTLISSERVLLREGEPIKIGSRALDILIALVSRAGEVVTKEELISAVWPRTFVEETNLRVNVAALRKALGDLQEPYRFISNITGRGYCFVASVSEVKEPARHIQAETSKPRQTLPATGSLPRQGACCRERLPRLGRLRLDVSSGLLDFADRCDEAVASASDVGDEPVGLLQIPERLAQGGDIDPEIGLLDKGSWPDGRDQLLLRNHLPGPAHERNEDVQGTAADLDWLALAQQNALRGNERERAESDIRVLHLA
jgi:DNA-binding winged helix-turn-helix (wHTH) protein